MNMEKIKKNIKLDKSSNSIIENNKEEKKK
jgi:hypothetical protein